MRMVVVAAALALSSCAHEESYREIDRVHRCLSAEVLVMVSGWDSEGTGEPACSVEDESGRMFLSSAGLIYPGGRACSQAELDEVGFGDGALPECAR